MSEKKLLTPFFNGVLKQLCRKCNRQKVKNKSRKLEADVKISKKFLGTKSKGVKAENGSSTVVSGYYNSGSGENRHFFCFQNVTLPFHDLDKGWSRYPKPGFLVSGFNLIFNFGAKGWKIIIQYGKKLAKYKELTTILKSIAFPTQKNLFLVVPDLSLILTIKRRKSYLTRSHCGSTLLLFEKKYMKK